MSLGDELRNHPDEIVQRWYDRWRSSAQARFGISEAALKDALPAQLHLIGEQLRDLATAEDPEKMWKVTERLKPEKRVSQDIPIDEVVQEYWLAVDVVRGWIKERCIDVPFKDYSYFYASMFDLTAESVERYAKRAAEDLQRHATELAKTNARLEEVDRLKSEFLATVSHELRTPLNSIIGFTGIMRQGKAGPLTDEQTKQLGIVQASAQHLLSLINDLLDVSRMDAGMIDLASEPFDFADVVREVLECLRPLAAQKRLALRVDLACTATEMVGDRKRCFQVLLNLVNNAVKFTERGEVCITARVEGGRLRVAVADTGIGIKPEHLGKLFVAFQQVDGSARRVYEGTGLGLYLCRKLLALMGGEIAVESEYQKGSRFTFSLPLRPLAPPEGVDASPAHGTAVRVTGEPKTGLTRSLS